MDSSTHAHRADLGARQCHVSKLRWTGGTGLVLIAGVLVAIAANVIVSVY